jgi:ACS family hexuronate transporter-like MFS transporter
MAGHARSAGSRGAAHRWTIAVLVFLATTVNYVDRQTISVAAPVISREFGFTAQDYSWIVFWFLFAYALMQVVAGWLVDHISYEPVFGIVSGMHIASTLFFVWLVPRIRRVM